MNIVNGGMPSVRLRAIEPEDLDTLYLMENDAEIWNVGTTNVPYSRYVLHDYVANVSGDIYTDKQVRLMIDDENGETVGMVDLVNFNPQHRRAELSIVVKKEKRRCGYAMATVMQIRKYALEILHLHQIYVVVDKENAASVALFTKMGFSVQCELPDWLFDGKNYKNSLVMQSFL